MAYRKQKLEEMLKRLVSEVIVKELNDPRIGFVTITGVSLNRDYSIAEVRVSILGEAKDIRKSFDGLKSSRGYIQKYVGDNLSIRHVPRIQFLLDSSVSDGVRMVSLLEGLDGVGKSDDEDDGSEE